MIPSTLEISDRIMAKIEQTYGALERYDRRNPVPETISMTFAHGHTGLEDFFGFYIDPIIVALKKQVDETRRYKVYVEQIDDAIGIYLVPETP